MHAQAMQQLKHDHDFQAHHTKGESRTRWVLAISFLTMLVEIAAGVYFGSMALLADGWHMATHVAAFMITLFAYRYSRIHADDQTFAFSSGKVGVLGGFTSSITLGMVAVIMLVESASRFFNPHNIHFDEAIMVACLGLFINVVCAVLLKEHDHHGHDHDHDDHHAHGHHDHNLKAAYFHVLADALTSVLAIAALLAGKYFALNWLDPTMGIVGALIISHWAYGLIKETSPLLIDASAPLAYKTAIQQLIEDDADNRVADLHIWRIGPGHFAAIVSVVSHQPNTPDYYKNLLHSARHLGKGNQLSHITIEVNRCPGDSCPNTTQGATHD
ncbi:CDF family Co(II)/Ni(II) efflux transporter DmeF [Methylosoma difficile]